MDEKDLLKVLRELQVYASPWKPVKQNSISCQTDFDENNNCDYPVIFCSQFSPESAVQTQCNIPQAPLHCRSCKETTVRVENASTQYDVTSTAIDYVFSRNDSRVRPVTPEEDYYDDVTESDTLFEDKEDLKSVRDILFKGNRQRSKLKNDLDKDIRKESSLDVPIRKSIKIHITRGLSDDEHANVSDGDVADNEREDHMDNDKPNNNEAAHPRKYEVCEKGNSSEEESQFWKEMKKVSMPIKWKLKAKKKQKKIEVSNTAENKGDDSSAPMKEEEVGTTEIENKMEDVSEGGWITDDEVDEDDDEVMDFTEAFKEEWKMKRVPNHTHEKNFVCRACHRPYSKKTYLREHIMRDHADHEIAREFLYVCVDCKRVYDAQKHLDHHRSLFCGPCEICGMMFGCSGLFWTHSNNHDAVCDICNKAFASLSVLYTHKKTKHCNKKLLCEICGKGFVYKSLLEIHVNKSHSLMPNDKICARKKEASNDTIDLNCSECDYVAKNEQSLRVHMGMAHKRKQRKSNGEVYSCPICNAQLSSKVVLKKHISRHEGSLPDHKCDYCQRMFGTEKRLFSHLKRAHGVQLHAPDSSTLQEIEGESHFIQCRSCECVFDSPFELQSHVLSVHSDIPKNIHIKIGQEADSCKCEFCGDSFEMPDALHNHRLTVHNIPHSVNAGIVEQRANASSLQVTNKSEDYQEITLNSSGRHSMLQESDCIQENLELAIHNSAEGVDSRTTLSLPACAVPANVNLVEIDGVQYHVVRGGQ